MSCRSFVPRRFPAGGVALALVLLTPAPALSRDTIVEHVSQWWPAGQGENLATTRYGPSAQEQPFFGRLAAEELVTGSFRDSYDISTKNGKFVGWFGIVRAITEDSTTDQTHLTIEHKYFDGLTDVHLQAVSFNGSGDFQVTLTGTGHRIPPLSLAKVYGTVTHRTAGTLPRIDAAFVRNWHWGTFTFIAAYGKQRGSERWRKLNEIDLDEIYDGWPHPCHHYYERRLGKRPDGPEIRKHLLDAAGALPPAARQAMERLADLIALGHTWSQSETMRQMREYSEIRSIVETKGSQQAAVDLLVQALHENDERVSWSASEKITDFDHNGDSIELLASLLESEVPRVRAGAARALRSGYGSTAAPAAAALSRCVSETDPDLKKYSIMALGSIGPDAKVALPELRKALTATDSGARVLLAESLWRIGQNPDDVIPAYVAVLADGDSSERHEAAEQLKEMGPWAAPAVPALIPALNDKEWTTRCEVAEALGEIGREAAPAIPAMVNLLESDEDSFVQSSVVEAFGRIGAPAAIPSLIAALNDEGSDIQSSAISALELFGHDAEAAVPALIQIVTDEGTNSSFAAKALGTIDRKGIGVTTLVNALRSANPQIRRFAALGICRLGRRAATAEQPLQRCLNDMNIGARIAAAKAHWSVSGKADEAVRVLRSAIQQADRWFTHMWAADALAEIGPAAIDAKPELIQGLNSSTRYVVTSSAEALGRIGPDAVDAVPALVARLEKTDDFYTRTCLARALWRMNRSEQSLPVLKAVLQASGDFMALSEAAETVGEIGRPAESMLPLLRPLRKHSDAFVRKAADNAIRQFEQQ